MKLKAFSTIEILITSIIFAVTTVVFYQLMILLNQYFQSWALENKVYQETQMCISIIEDDIYKSNLFNYDEDKIQLISNSDTITYARDSVFIRQQDTLATNIRIDDVIAVNPNYFRIDLKIELQKDSHLYYVRLHSPLVCFQQNF